MDRSGEEGRLLSVLVTIFVGFAVPSFTKFSNLVGSLGLSTVGFLIPPLLFVKAKGGGEVTGWEWVAVVGVVAVGVFDVFFEGGKAVSDMFWG